LNNLYGECKAFETGTLNCDDSRFRSFIIRLVLVGKKTQINLKFETDFVKKGKIFVNLILSHRHLGSNVNRPIVHIQALADIRGVHTQDNNKNTLYEKWDIYEFTYIHFEKMHFILIIYVLAFFFHLD
jgi:hypothetical protein